MAAIVSSFCLTTEIAAVDSNMAPNNSQKALKIGVVNFKLAVEESKAGKQEQTNFESLKKQMESVLEEKERA